MPFDPTKPTPGTEIDANELRAQLNGLKDLIDAVPAGPPGPAGADGNDGAPGPQGPQGPPGPPFSSALPGPAIIQGRVIAESGDFTLAASDPNGSGETSLTHSTENVPGGLIPVISAKLNGTHHYIIRQDPAGILDGSGTPTIQDGDHSRYDAATQTMKPARRPGLAFADLLPLTDPIENPPTQANVQALRDRLNEFLIRLQGL